MRKLSVLFLSILTVGLSVVSCSSDDNDEKVSIEGKWEIVQSGIIANGKESVIPILTDGNCGNATFEYYADGKFIDTTTEFWDSKCSTYVENGTWSKDGNTLNLKYGDDETSKIEILELSKSRLKIKFAYSEENVSITGFSVYERK